MSAPVSGLDALTSAEAQLQKLMVSLQQKELAVSAETRPNNVTIAYDLETATATFTAAAVPITIASASNGDLTITAASYALLT